MILFLLTNWRWLAPSLLAAALGIMLGISRIELSTDHAKINRQNAEASALLTQLTETAAKKDSAAAEFARNLDEVHTNAAHEIALAGDTSQRAFTEQLRRIAAGRPSCAGTGTAEAFNAGLLADSARVRQDRLLEGIAERLKRLGIGANANAELIRDVCVPWANQVGR